MCSTARDSLFMRMAWPPCRASISQGWTSPPHASQASSWRSPRKRLALSTISRGIRDRLRHGQEVPDGQGRDQRPTDCQPLFCAATTSVTSRPLATFRLGEGNGLQGSAKDFASARECLPSITAGSSASTSVKSFGRREAYESPRGRNPRTPVEGYGDFSLRLMCAVPGSQSGSGMIDGGQVASLRARVAFRAWPRLAATLSAAMITKDACGSVAGGGAPATEVLTMPCRVMKLSPGSSPAHPAARAAASSVQTPR